MNGIFGRVGRRELRLGVRLALVIGLAGGAATAQATTFVVDTSASGAGINACTAAPNDCSFEGALTRIAASGDTLQLAVPTVSVTGGTVQILTSVTIEANSASLPRLFIGGGSMTGISVVVKNARFENLVSASSGGAIYVQRTQNATILDSRFSNNRTGSSGNPPGGAIYSNGGLTVVRSSFDGNYGASGGSAIQIDASGSLNLADSIFTGNGLYANGALRAHFGAIVNAGSATIQNCLFQNNESDYASAIQIAGQTWIYNSSFVGNVTRASTESGAVLVAAPTVMINDTLVGNSGATSGGIYVYDSGPAQLQIGNTLLSDNTGTSPNIRGIIYSLGYNLIRDPTGMTNWGSQIGNLYNVDPRVLPLTSNGGNSAIVPLAPDSPAIDAGGNCVLTAGACTGTLPTVALGTDQRGTGFARQRGGRVDIGASENPYLTVSNVNDSGAGSLRQAISDAASYDTVVFSSAVFNVARTITLATPLAVSKTVTIKGTGSGLLTLDGNNVTRQVNIDAPGLLTLTGARLIRGNPGAGISAGAIRVNGGTLNGDDLVFDSNRSNLGGCLFVNGTATANLTRSVFSGCQATDAGALHVETGGSASLTDIRFENNSAAAAGGAVFSRGSLSLSRTSITGGSAVTGAGFYNAGTATLRNVTISGNSNATGKAGGIFQNAIGSIALLGSTITANSSAAFGGGGLWNDGGTVTVQDTLIAGNSGANGQPDVVGVLTSAGFNLIGSNAGNSFAAGSSSLAGNLVNVAAKLSPLADNGGYARTHAPLYDSPILDAAGFIAGSSVDARALTRPIDFDYVANASGGDGSDIGAYELQVATPSAIVVTPMSGALSVAFDGGAHGGLVPTSFLVRCGAQSASGSASPIVVGGLANGTAVTCTVTASAGSVAGITSGPSPAVAPGNPPGAPTIGAVTIGNGQARVAFTAPASDGGSPITGFTATCGSRSATGTSSPISVIGLINQAVVTCSVLARNAVGPGPSSAASASVTPGLPGAYAYIPRVGSASLAVVDLGTGNLGLNIALGNGNTGVAVSPDGARVYLANQGSNQVTVIDTLTNAVVTQVTVGNAPWSAAVSPDSRRVYVANSGDTTVSVIDAASNTVQRTYTMFFTPYGLAVSPDGRYVYATIAGTNAIQVIDTSNDTLLGPYTVGMDPVGVATSPDGRRVYVTSQSTNRVAVLDAADNSLVASIPAGGTPFGVVVSRDSRRVYVANASSNSVSVIDAASNTVIATVTVGLRPGGIDVSPDGRRVYVADRDSNDVSVIDTATNFVIATTALGASSTPYAMGRFVAVAGVQAAATGTQMPDAAYGADYHQVLPFSGMPRPSLVLVNGTLPAGLAFDGSDNSITGTTTALGSYTLSFRASNGVGGYTTQQIGLNVVPTRPNPPTITGIVGGDGRVSVSFTAPAFDGGSAVTSYRVSCVSGLQDVVGDHSPIVVPVPNGLSTLCNVFAINAVGSSLQSYDSAVVIVGVAPAFTSPDAVNGAFGLNFQFPVTATGAPTPTLALDSGSLPPGLSFDAASGVVSGVPTLIGDYSATIVATNAVGSMPQTLQFHIAPWYPNAPTITSAVGGDGSVTLTYVPDAFDGGSPVVYFSALCEGSATVGTTSAPGLSVTVPGLANGVPTRCRIAAANAKGVGAYSAYTDAVTPGVGPSFTSASTVSGTYGEPMTFTVSANGAPAPTLSLVSGNLPGGLAFDAATGVLSGTPTAVTPGTPVTLRASSVIGAVDQVLAITIAPALPSAPTNLTATSGHGQASIAFTPPMTSGGVAIDHYSARCLPGDVVASSATLSIVVPLGNGTIYDCRVHASNAAGDGPESASVRVLPRAVDSTDLAVSISNGTPYVIGGMPTTYVISVDNDGAAGVIGARVTDALGSDFSDAHWTCMVRNGADCPASGSGDLDTQVDLPPGSGVRIELTATVAPLPETPVSTVVSVTGPADVTESDLANNVASDGPDGRGLFKDGYE